MKLPRKLKEKSDGKFDLIAQRSRTLSELDASYRGFKSDSDRGNTTMRGHGRFVHAIIKFLISYHSNPHDRRPPVTFFLSFFQTTRTQNLMNSNYSALNRVGLLWG